MKLTSEFVMRLAGQSLVALAIFAGVFGRSAFAGAGVPVPEIDAGSAVSAITLISGAVLVFSSRSRRK
jgi:hypothetical protein